MARRWALRWPTLREAGAVVVLALAYFAAAKLAQTLRYTASVSAIWPPVGLGIAALYLFGLRLWPGVFLGELLVNANLLFEGSNPPPLGSVMGQQVGNMAEVIFGAWLLGRLIGPRAKLERASEVGWMTVAVGTAAGISATVGTISMLAGGVITVDEIPTFWRTWVLGDTAGALVVLPLCLTWADPARAWRRVRRFEGALVIGLVAVLASVAVLSDAPLTYLTFPALIWAAFRFGPPGVTLATALMAGVTIGITADQVGAFYKQPIDNRTLSTQLYILVGSLTALFLSAVISERERSTTELAASKRRELERAIDERRRIARELHDSVSQTLFSSTLHSRAAQKALAGASEAPQVRQQLQAIDELTKRAQSEMRRFIFEWGPSEVGDGLVPALTRHVSSFAGNGEFRIRVEGPTHPLPVQLGTETQLYAIAREAVANVVRHAGAGSATIRVEATDGEVVLEIADDGCGFDPQAPRTGRSFGLESMRTRASEIGAELAVISAPGRGTVVRVELPAEDGLDDA